MAKAEKKAPEKTIKIVSQKKQTEVPENGFANFQYGGKKYKIVYPGINLPGIGPLTAADISIHEEAQKHLVENKSHAIQEIV